MLKTWKMSAIAVTIGISGALVAGCSPDGNENNRTLSVSGSADVQVVPDRSTISATISGKGSSNAASIGVATAASDSVTAAVKKAGVPDNDVKTSSVQSSEDSEKKEFTTRMQYTVKVNQKDVDKVLGAINSAGGDMVSVSGVSSEVSAPEKFAGEARKKAFENAKSQAEDLAKAAGVKLKKVVSVTDGTPNAPRPYPNLRGSAEAVAPMHVSPGTSDVSATVSVVWEIS